VTVCGILTVVLALAVLLAMSLTVEVLPVHA
jgi:hypothetical protein